MVNLGFYGGVNEIGGNKILIEDGDAKCWFDFGQSFTMGANYYTGYLQPRTINGLQDYFEFSLVPKIPGLYDAELLKRTNLQYKDPQFDAVFLTHAHMDHVNQLCLIDPKIPVYLGEGTKIFMDTMEQTSGTSYGTHPYHMFRTGATIKIGKLEVEPIHVDHSIPAAYGYLIHTSEGTIVYTGDYRTHGTKSDMTEEFIECAIEHKPVAMITEGTRMELKSKRHNLTESQVYQGVLEICKHADTKKQMLIYTHGPRDMDRLRTFYKAAEACERMIVISPKTAHLLDRLISDEHLDLPDPVKDDLIAVYYKRKKSGEYDPSDYYKWERSFLSKRVTIEELKAYPQRYVLNIDFFSLGELIDIRPELGTHYIHSMSEPFGEEDIESQVLQNWIKHFKLNYQQLHASGHIGRKELIETINRIKPRKIFPIHTENPAMFDDYYSNVIKPELGKNYSL